MEITSFALNNFAPEKSFKRGKLVSMNGPKFSIATELWRSSLSNTKTLICSHTWRGCLWMVHALQQSLKVKGFLLLTNRACVWPVNHFYVKGRTGVFSWCMISWLYFLCKVHLGNFSLWSMTLRFPVTRKELELLTDIHDFTTLFHVFLRCETSNWLELFIKSDLGIHFAI